MTIYNRRSAMASALAAAGLVMLPGTAQASQSARRLRRKRLQLERALRINKRQKLTLGELSAEDNAKLQAAIDDKEAMYLTLAELEVNDSALGAVDWGGLIEWIKAHWFDILKLIFSLLIFI